MSICTESESRAKPVGSFELLVRSGDAWTPMGRFRTRHNARLCGLRMGLDEKQFIIEDHRPRRQSGREWVAIVGLFDRQIVKITENFDEASRLLKSGRCYGKGETKQEAIGQALCNAARIAAELLDSIQRQRRKLERSA